MSIPLHKVDYKYLTNISSKMADFLDTLSADGSPTRLYLSNESADNIRRLKEFAAENPDDAGIVELILEEMNKEGEIDLAWG